MKKTNDNLKEIAREIEESICESIRIKAVLETVADSWDDITMADHGGKLYEISRISERIETLLSLSANMLDNIANTNNKVVKDLILMTNTKEGDC